jgi:hypothetical protein
MAVYMTTLHPHLARTLAELDRILAAATPEQLDAKPRADKWSAAEILEHLDKTYSSSARLFEKILENGELRVQPRTTKQLAAQFVVIGLGHMPRGRPAPAVTIPTGAPAAEVTRSVRADFIRMAGLHTQIAQRFGGRRISQHPVLGALTPNAWAKFHWVHGQHHFRQIDALLRRP